MAMYGDAEVVSGTRSTIAEEALAAKLAKKGPDLKAIRRKAAIALAEKRGLPVYESNYSRLRIQIASPRDFADANGRQRMLPGIAARFNFCLYTPVSVLRRGTPEHDEEIKLIIDALESHPKFGINKLFWRADEMARIEKEIQYQEAVDLLEKDPELKSRFLATVSADTMDAAVVRTQAKRRGVIEDARGTEKFRPIPAATEAEDRAAIMERAERSRDELARKVRRDAGLLGDDVPLRKKKKKKRRHNDAVAPPE